jgi:hypothetical protein
MIRRTLGLAVAALIAIGAPAAADAQNVDGKWKLVYIGNGNLEVSLAIVTLKTEGGKTTGETVAGRPVKSVSVEGDTLRVVLQSTPEIIFEAAAPKEATKQVPGVIMSDTTLLPALLMATEDAKLSNIKVLNCPPLQEARTLAAKAAKLRQSYMQEKDADKKAELLKEYAEADIAAKKEAPRLYKEVIRKYADNPVIFDAGIAVLRSARAHDVKADDVKAWAEKVAEAASEYGPRWHAEIARQLATVLARQGDQPALALIYAKEAEKTLTPKSTPTEQAQILSVLAEVLRKNGKNDEAGKLEARVAKLEETADADYHAKMPGFKGDAFTGRTSKSERAVFMELFTGAACPPCVAADLAFEVLQKTYKPGELVLIQYHMHIPGPDPLTNTDTEARWNYYRAAYPKQVGGVPSSIFNGKPQGGGGGPAANAENKYQAYRKIIEPLLEEEAGAKLAVKAERAGDKIDINVKVLGLADPGKDKKLRILLTEETVRYLGPNKVRFHHNVVRACPGGAEGHTLTEAASKHNASVNLAELRGNLTKYLDDFEINSRAFANPSRPLALSRLRVIAFVQDDTTHEILQVVQVEVPAK